VVGWRCSELSTHLTSKAHCILSARRLPRPGEPIAPFPRLVSVIPADVSQLLDGLHALAVHDGHARVEVAADTLAFGAMLGRIKQMPGTLETILSKESPPPCRAS
jgi:hypothetical protein